MAKPISLSPQALAELPQRLLNSAEAFFFAGLLCGGNFDASCMFGAEYYNVNEASQAILSSTQKKHYLGAPPLVNFALSIELYLKFLIVLEGGPLSQTHSLCALFKELSVLSPDTGAQVVDLHRHARGLQDEFSRYLLELDKQFIEWRYAHEKDVLVAYPDDSLMMINALRAAVRSRFPGVVSVFATDPHRE